MITPCLLLRCYELYHFFVTLSKVNEAYNDPILIGQIRSVNLQDVNRYNFYLLLLFLYLYLFLLLIIVVFLYLQIKNYHLSYSSFSPSFGFLQNLVLFLILVLMNFMILHHSFLSLIGFHLFLIVYFLCLIYFKILDRFQLKIRDRNKKLLKRPKLKSLIWIIY